MVLKLKIIKNILLQDKEIVASPIDFSLKEIFSSSIVYLWDTYTATYAIVNYLVLWSY